MDQRQTFLHFAIGYLTILAPGRLQRDGLRVLTATREAAVIHLRGTRDAEHSAWDFAQAVAGHLPASATEFGDVLADLASTVARVEHDPEYPERGSV